MILKDDRGKWILDKGSSPLTSQSVRDLKKGGDIEVVVKVGKRTWINHYKGWEVGEKECFQSVEIVEMTNKFSEGK